MRTLLLCTVVAVCVCGTFGARRRLLAGPPRRPIQRRPFGWPKFQPQNERLDYPRAPGRVPPQQLRLAPREPFRQAPQESFYREPQEQYVQEFQGPFRAEPQEPFRPEPEESFSLEQQEQFVDGPQEPFRSEPQEPFRSEPQEPFRSEPQEPFRSEPQEPFRQEPQEPFRQEPQQQYVEPQKPIREEPQTQYIQETPAFEKVPSPVRKNPVLEKRQESAPETVVEKRQDFAPLPVERKSDRDSSFSEPEAAADSPQEQYSLKIPEKQEKQRLEFQVHGQQGPHSYRFGYDTGSGYNRQFRFEERDADGNLKGRYGYYKDGKLQVVNYSATHKGGFHAEGDFGKFPEKSH